MLFKKPLKYVAILIIIILSVSISVYGCKGMFSRNIQEEELAEEQNTVKEESQADIDYETKIKAFETAHVYVEQRNPDATFNSGYSEDKVIAESGNLFKVIIDFSSEGSEYIWEILLEYNKENDNFTVIEAPGAEGQIAQESYSEESSQEKPEEIPEEPQEEPPTEEQPNESQETSPETQQPQTSEGKKQLSLQEIKSGALNAAREDVLKNYPSAIFTKSYDENLIEDLGNNFYQCCIVCTQPAPGFVFLYLVRYDPNEIKWYTPFKTDYLNFHTRAANSVKNYIEKQDNWVQNNCNGVIFDNDSVKVNEWKDSNGKTVLCKFKVDIKFQCQGKDGSLKWYNCSVNTRYDILSDSFVDFDMGCTGS